MIAFMPESRGNVIGIRASGKLTRADYRRVLIPHLEALIAEHGKLRALFLMDEGFTGWSLSAAWQNTVLVVRHRADLERVAMVGSPRWEEWCIECLAAPLIKGAIHTFRRAELAEAWAWLVR